VGDDDDGRAALGGHVAQELLHRFEAACGSAESDDGHGRHAGLARAGS
jgi:hypothetical protein